MDQWYVTRGDITKGPYTLAQLKLAASKGQLRLTDRLQQHGTTGQVAAGQVDGLFPPSTLPARSSEDAPKDVKSPRSDSDTVVPTAKSDIGAPRKRKWFLPVAAGLLALGTTAAALTALLPRAQQELVAKQAEPDVSQVDEPDHPEPEAEPQRKAKAGRKPPPAKNRPDPKKPPEQPRRKPQPDNPPAKTRPSSGPADLDTMVQLLCGRGATGEEMLMKKAENGGVIHNVFAQLADIKPTHDKNLYDLEWVERMNDLARSDNPDVARAARAASALRWHHMQIFKLQIEADDSLKQSVDRKAIVNAWSGILDSIGESDNSLNDQVDRGLISQETAAAMRSARAERDTANAAALTPLARSLALSHLTKESVSRIRTRITALKADVLQKHLASALRSRAETTSSTPPITMKCGGGNRRRDGTSEAAFLAGVVGSGKPLTRVALLVEQKVGFAKQVSTYYFPRVEPGASFRTIQSALVNGGLIDEKLERSKYSIWCDQIAAEGVPAEDLPFGEAMLEYAGFGLRPGTEYLSVKTGSGGTQIRMELVEFERSGGTSDVKARFTLSRGDSAEVLTQAEYSGTAAPGPPDRLPPEVKLTMRAGNDELALSVLCESDGRLPVTVRGRKLSSTALLPAALVRKEEQAQANFKAQHARQSAVVDEARQLALGGRRDEAERKLREFIAGETEERWTVSAKRLLEQLDELVRIGKNRQGRPPAGANVFGQPKPK